MKKISAKERRRRSRQSRVATLKEDYLVVKEGSEFEVITQADLAPITDTPAEPAEAFGLKLTDFKSDICK